MKPKDLPVLSSNFYTTMCACRPAGTSVDIKHSSYKKLSKFLQEMRSQDLLTVKDNKGVQSITSINFKHSAIVSFKPVAQEAIASVDQGSAAATNTATKDRSDLSVTELFRALACMAPVLDCAKDSLLTKQEIAERFAHYAQSRGLVSPAKLCRVDENIYEAIYHLQPAHTRKEVGDEVTLEELVNTCVSRMAVFHEVKVGGVSQIRKGTVKTIKIMVDDRSGGRKHTTRVQNLESFGIDPEEISKDWQKRMAASTSVTPLPGKNEKGVEVCVQGDMLKLIADALVRDWQVPKKFIEVMEKKKAGGKK